MLALKGPTPALACRRTDERDSAAATETGLTTIASIYEEVAESVIPEVERMLMVCCPPPCLALSEMTVLLEQCQHCSAVTSNRLDLCSSQLHAVTSCTLLKSAGVLHPVVMQKQPDASPFLSGQHCPMPASVSFYCRAHAQKLQCVIR